MSLATVVRETIEGFLRKYESADGISRDAYSARPSAHAMAEGKYLQTLASLRRSGLIGSADYLRRVTAASNRLVATAIHRPDLKISWGLGFSWRDCDKYEPFLITTAIVVRGLTDVCVAERKTDTALLMTAIHGLSQWFEALSIALDNEGAAATFPIYSPNMALPVTNAAAYGASTLHVAVRSGFVARVPKSVPGVIDHVRSVYLDGIGWNYMPRNLVVDLVHQCYILDSLLGVYGCESTESTALATLGNFWLGEFTADRGRWMETLGKDTAVPMGAVLRQCPSGWLVMDAVPARLWSLGEMSVIVARLARVGCFSEYWMGVMRRLALALISRLTGPPEGEAEFFRHTTHAAHGLAETLETLRMARR